LTKWWTWWWKKWVEEKEIPKKNSASFMIFTDSVVKVFQKITILFFKEKWIGKNWREIQLYLHEDSTLSWFSGSGARNL
jgi:hypothetical protein